MLSMRPTFLRQEGLTERQRGRSVHFEKLIRPAILQLLAEEDGGYRVERELHHHLTVCLERIMPLRLGRQDRLVKYEEPTKAKYKWSGRGSKAGNIDLLFPTRQLDFADSDTAMELNFNYDGWNKIEQDFIKLIDPRNAYKEAVYFAYSFKPHFREAVMEGLGRAFQWFKEDKPDFLLPAGLHILVVENQLGGAGRVLWEATVQEPSLAAQFEWDQVSLPRPDGPAEDRRGPDKSTGESEPNNSSLTLSSVTREAQIKTTRETVWYYFAENTKRHFIAFVNAKGSCSKRVFDAETGDAFKKGKNMRGDYREVFRECVRSATSLPVSPKVNLDKECKVQLPSPVLTELRRQIPRSQR